MMELVDELATPGCPQCAVKHLSAALAYLLTPGRWGLRPFGRNRMWLAVAKINLAEVLVGYESHLWYAVGMLQRSEETALGEGSAYAVARQARLMLEERGLDSAADALREIESGVVFEPSEMAGAHLYEAAREMPGELNYPVPPDESAIVRAIERIRGEYFDFDDLPSATVAVGEQGQQTGGMDMATAKKAKAAPAKKCAKCASKGGKTAKCCKK